MMNQDNRYVQVPRQRGEVSHDRSHVVAALFPHSRRQSSERVEDDEPCAGCLDQPP
jgi:hypothetical protein